MSLALTILTVLRNCDGYLLPWQTLVAEIRLRDGRPTLAEIETTVGNLEAAGHVAGLRNPDAPGGSKWKITDAGKLRLAEAGV